MKKESKNNKKIILIIAILFLFLLAFGFLNKERTFKENRKDFKCPDCNVILITIDTLRADHLPCYGYERNTTPFICSLAEEGILFENAFSSAPWTLPSTASIFTGLYPYNHKASLKKNLDNQLETLPEILKKNGFYNIAYVQAYFASSKFNFDQGFDEFYDELYNFPMFDNFSYKLFNWSIEFIENNTQPYNKPVFIYLHMFDPHFPYIRSKPEFFLEENETNPLFDSINNNKILRNNDLENSFLYNNLINLTKHDIEYGIKLYDNEIFRSDQNVKRIVELLKKRDIYNNSIIIITADHGESFGENGQEFFHHALLYDNQIKVPLIIHLPKKPSSNIRITNLVESVDILPTILGVLNLEIPQNIDGINLMPNILNTKKETKKIIKSFRYFYNLRNKSSYAAIRDNTWKIIKNLKNDSIELYFLSEDHFEEENVYDKYPKLAHSLEMNIDHNLVFPQEKINKKEYYYDKETLKKIKSLGYLN